MRHNRQGSRLFKGEEGRHLTDKLVFRRGDEQVGCAAGALYSHSVDEISGSKFFHRGANGYDDARKVHADDYWGPSSCININKIFKGEEYKGKEGKEIRT